MDTRSYDFSDAKKSLGRVALAMVAIVILSLAASLIIVYILERCPPLYNFFKNNELAAWILNMVPLYGCAIPPALLILKKVPKGKLFRRPLEGSHFLEAIPICIFMMYAGSIIGKIMSALISGGTAVNPVETYLEDYSILTFISVVILPPLVEEYVFRKTLIDHTVPYGEKWAVLLSAVTFGLIHQNFFQFFYAFGIGLVLGYIYVRTGRLRYTVILHGLLNFMGGFLAPWLAKFSALQEAENFGIKEYLLLQLVAMYSVTTLGLMIFGLIRFIIRCKWILWIPREKELPYGCGFKAVFLNPYMILFTLLSLGMSVYALF